MRRRAWVMVLILGSLPCLMCSLVSAEALDVTNATTVDFSTGSMLDIVFPFPDLSFIGGVLPTTLFMNALGPVPSQPFASYEFTSRLESLDGKTTITLPAVQGTAGTACLNPFSCTEEVPIIQFTIGFSDGPGLGILPPNGVAGQPGGELVLTNIGPAVELGGIFPGQTLGELLSVTLGNGQQGEDLFASTVSLVPVPEPTTLSMFISLYVFVLVAGRSRLSNKNHP